MSKAHALPPSTEPEMELFTASFLLSEFRKDNREMRNEFKQDLASLRNEFKNDMQEMRTEFRHDMQEMRTEFRHDMQEMRTEFRHDMQEMRSEFKSDIKHLGARIDTLSNRMYTNSVTMIVVLVTAFVLPTVWPYLKTFLPVASA